MGLVDVGVRLVMDGLAAFQQGQQSANQSTASLNQQMLNLTNTINNRLNPASMIMNNALGQQLSKGIDMVTSKIDALVGGSLDVASKFEQLQQVAYNLAQQNGQTAESVDKNINTIRKYGIEAGVAANLVINFSRYNLDLAKSTELARVAQDQAQVSGSNSSETLERLLYGIQTYNTEVFRTAGLNINMQQAFDKYAKTLNKTSEGLTNTERSQAVLNAVLEEGKKSAGSYEASLGTASKVWGSYERIVNDLQLTLGTPFLKASMTAGQALTDFTKRINDAFMAGGRLAPMLDNLELVSWAFFDAIKSGAGEAANAFINFFSGPMFSGITSLIGNMAQWGFNLVSSFAIGIAEGTGTVLAVAMQGIGDLITYFLEAHSPPNLLPDIDKWGAGAMTAYLEGFSEADFSVFNSLGGTIRSTLSAIGMDAGKQDQVWKKLAGSMTAALSGAGGPEFIAQIKNELGGYGEEVGQLAELQLKLASATEKVTAAEKALEAARKAEQEAGENITKTVNEYNQLAQTEKDPAKLAAKRAEIMASKTAYKTAVEKRKEDEKAVTQAKEGIDTLQQQVKLQQDLVNALIEMTKEYKEAGKAAKEATGKGETKDPSEPIAKAAAGVKSLQVSIDGFKQKLMTIFQPVADSFNLHVAPVFKEFERQVLRVMDLLVQVGILTKVPGNQLKEKRGFQDLSGDTETPDTYGMSKFGTEIDETVVKIGAIVGGLWLVSKPLGFILGVVNKLKLGFVFLAGIGGKIGLALSKITWPGTAAFAPASSALNGILTKFGAIGVIIAGIIFSVNAIATDWQGIVTTASRLGAVIEEIFKNPGKYDLGKIFGESITEKFDEIFGKPIREVFKQIGIDVENIDLAKTLVVVWYEYNKLTTKAWEAIKKVLADAWEKIKTAMIKAWDKIKSILLEVWNKILKGISDILEKIKRSITQAWESIKNTLTSVWNKIKDTAETIFNKIKDTLEDIWEQVKDTVERIWTGIKTWVETTWNNIKTSASEIFNKIKDTIEDVWNKIKSTAESIWSGIKTWIETTWNNLKTSAETIWNNIKTSLETIWNNIVLSATTIWNSVVTEIKKAWDGVVAWVNDPEGPIQKIKFWIIDTWDKLKTAAYDYFEGPEGIITKLKAWWEDFKNKIKIVAEGISKPFEDAFKGTIDWAKKLLEKLGEIWTWFQIITGLDWGKVNTGGGTSGTGLRFNPSNALASQRVTPPASAQAMMMNSYSNSQTNQYNLTLQTRQSVETVRQGFAVMQILGA